MKKVSNYLNFNGNTEEAFNFYKTVFGGEFMTIQRFKDTPDASKIPPGVGDKIMHIALPIGNGDMLMGTDAVESMGQKVTFGNNLYLLLDCDSQAEADKLFNGLSSGGHVEMGMQNTFWGAYFGSFKDKFGVQWMINYSQQSM